MTQKKSSDLLNRCIPSMSWLVAFSFRHYL